MFQKIRTKLGAKLIAWHALVLIAPVVLSVTTFGLALYVQPMPAPKSIDSQKVAGKKSITHHAAAVPKVTQPVAAPKVAAAPPSTPPPPPVKAPVRSGTPKPEPVVTPSPSSSVSGLAPTTPAPAPASPQAPPQTTTGYTSSNWSGYLATNASFTAVSGSWTATLAAGNGSTTSADSTWIGIGGVTSADLIQVGTQNIIAANGQVSTSAFYELLPNVSQPVPGVTVSPGDSMTASISQISGGQWSISITDKTNGQSSTFTVSYASSLSSAEWIEEDPSFSFRRQIPFDNFHQAAFTGASTVANGVTYNLATGTAQPVTMVNNAGQPVAVPSAIGSDGASFTVTP
jgi:hypothetical protein